MTISCFNCGKYEQCQFRKDQVFCVHYELNPQTQKDNTYDKLYKALTDTSQNTAREFLNMQLGNVFGMPSSTDAERK